MDFLKACSTNVQRIDDVNSMSYAIYSYEGTSPNDSLTFNGILIRLRVSNVLCCEHNGRLYTFGNPPEQDAALQPWTIQEKGTIQDYSSISEIVDRLKDAIDVSLSSRLVNTKHTYRLGSWTWLHHEEGDYSQLQATVSRIHTTFVPPGSISFVTRSQKVALVPYTLDTQTTSLLLSPSGACAERVVVGQDNEVLEDSSEQAWRTTVMQSLQVQGLNLADEQEWIRVKLRAEADIVFSWPQSLCFVRQQARPAMIEAITKHGILGQIDALTFAQQWAESAEERQQAVLSAQNTQNDAVENTHASDEMDLITSPPFLYRPELSNLSGIYPTPPDGMVTHAATQASLQNESSAQNHQDLIQDNNELFRMQTNDGDTSLEPRPRGPSIASSVGMELQQPLTDDLFGDGEFGGDEVDEDDFDFFDDQAERAQAPSLQEQSTDVSELAVTQSTSAMVVDPHDENDAVMVDAASSPAPGAPVTPSATTAPVRGSADHSAHASDEKHALSIALAKQLKPLSPFDIRERLLPPPVPASMTNQSQRPSTGRRQSSFAPIVFNPDLKLGSRLQSYMDDVRSSGHPQSSRATSTAASPLPTNEKHGSPASSQVDDARFSSSDEDTSDSNGPGIRTMPPQLPWHTRKRKRFSSADEISQNSWTVQASPMRTNQSSVDMSKLLAVVLETALDTLTILGESAKQSRRSTRLSSLPLESCFDGSTKDLLMIAQLASEQAITCTQYLLHELDIFRAVGSGESQDLSSAQATVNTALAELLPGSRQLDLVALALQRDVQRPATQITKGQPRPPLRTDAVPGVELYPLAAPYLRFHRAETAMEMLPPAVHFWEALALGPVNGSKDIRPFYVVPDDKCLQDRLMGFSEDFRAAYEGCKLGQMHDATSDLTSHWSVVIDDPSSYDKLYLAYHTTCKNLADHLVHEAFTNPAHSFVAVLIDPFNDPAFAQVLCACFWLLYKSYRDRIVRKGQHKKASDVCLQIIPAALFCSPDTCPILTSAQMAVLAREVYDRCPPNEDIKQSSPLAIATAPSIILADSLPKRINFQLTANAPTDLLHEGSEVHVAYARSADGLWITAAWMDNTGVDQQTSSFCLRGTTPVAIFTEIWSRSLDIIQARSISWRVSIATDKALDELEVQCWRGIMSSQLQKRGALHASLVVVQSPPLLSVKASMQVETSTAVAPGVITPVSTPLASGFTFSPDATGQTAPPTPAPTESSVENEPDAHLVDLPDETWGMLLDPKFNLVQQYDHAVNVPAIAQGSLIKHGDVEKESTLPVLGVSIVHTLRVRGNGTAAEDATPKQAEIILKELLVSYRGLALLAKSRGLQGEETRGMPLHIVCALSGAAAVNNLLMTGTK